MFSVLKWARSIVRRAPSPPMRFPTSGFPVVPADVQLEEESSERFETGRYYPINIGDVLASKYQVVGKLGWGVTSTAWLARDLM
jgi:serine/threonine-protein kinase SRPK3